MEAKRIVCVDDEPEIRSLYRLMLKKHNVVAVATTSQGWRELNDHTHLLITDNDTGAGEMSGISLIRRVRETFPKLPCLLVTANQAVQYDGNVLFKPFTMARLVHFVDLLLEIGD